MQIEAYLQRIGLDHQPTPQLQSLQLLQRQHLINVPFENLDIHLGRPITLNYYHIYEKIVQLDRGGFCYELNGLFYFLLKELGFEVKRISAMTYNEQHGYRYEYDHLALLVQTEGQEWLTDVGFGRFSLVPLSLNTNQVQTDGRQQYLLRPYEAKDGYTEVLSKKIGAEEDWKPCYIFTKVERMVEEFADMCHYHQTNPESHFLKGPMCTRATEDGRVTIWKNKLKIEQGETINEVPINSDKVLWEKLKAHFNVHIQVKK
ncbi:MAG: arylamine N-acetyltransferase [Saprospiraceae bacterium]|nr:arylamine N-acetyltransferase [Saprospiraceae bacterium]